MQFVNLKTKVTLVSSDLNKCNTLLETRFNFIPLVPTLFIYLFLNRLWHYLNILLDTFVCKKESSTLYKKYNKKRKFVNRVRNKMTLPDIGRVSNTLPLAIQYTHLRMTVHTTWFCYLSICTNSYIRSNTQTQHHLRTVLNNFFVEFSFFFGIV